MRTRTIGGARSCRSVEHLDATIRAGGIRCDADVLCELDRIWLGPGGSPRS
ncbi:hypothetical protein ACFT1A_29500 [Rhodococcus sp. NPDC057135]|uniref:hypothetical protein n=1 Tax=Rhodococcus sp. NPDC057135 TaxID=3346028 RepID=UPI003635498F